MICKVFKILTYVSVVLTIFTGIYLLVNSYSEALDKQIAVLMFIASLVLTAFNYTVTKMFK